MGLYNSLSATYGFKVDPDHRQDRCSSEVTTRKVTEEELEKYKNGGTYKKPSMAGLENLTKRKDEDMKINKVRLIEICNEYGFTKEAYNMAAEEFGVKFHAIECYVSNNKLREKVDKAEEKCTQGIRIQKNSIKKAKPEDETKVTPPIIDAELEVLGKIKTIVEENRALKIRMSQLKASLEEILKSIA